MDSALTVDDALAWLDKVALDMGPGPGRERTLDVRALILRLGGVDVSSSCASNADSRVEELEAEVDVLRKQSERYREQIQRGNAVIHELHSTRRQLEQTLGDLERRLDSDIADSTRFQRYARDSFNFFERSLRSLQHHVEALEDANGALEERNGTLVRELRAQHRLTMRLLKRAFDLEDDLESLRDQHRLLAELYAEADQSHVQTLGLHNARFERLNTQLKEVQARCEEYRVQSEAYRAMADGRSRALESFQRALAQTSVGQEIAGALGGLIARLDAARR
ncbi:hypothetical protein GMRT_12274 [Giardia muris]|uniref:Uncharacterized protein n=1 Tax=Giardia muris TaxID=5742 RepID=A0A4Z1SYM1_GIAMU|nr:hypothetical protein GMRT_12274 [Giardia muris]|eukprot:TNJ30570.1 hypothetical protein GMRT_12274 [Giardia muris]